MSFEWTEYLGLAQELAGQSVTIQPEPEARYRTSISRAYYSAYCQARNYLRSRGIHIPPPHEVNVHRYVINKFNESIDLDYQKIAKDLERLLNDRNMADYEDIWNVDISKTARSAISSAERLLKRLRSLPKR